MNITLRFEPPDISDTRSPQEALDIINAWLRELTEKLNMLVQELESKVRLS